MTKENKVSVDKEYIIMYQSGMMFIVGLVGAYLMLNKYTDMVHPITQIIVLIGFLFFCFITYASLKILNDHIDIIHMIKNNKK